MLKRSAIDPYRQHVFLRLIQHSGNVQAQKPLGRRSTLASIFFVTFYCLLSPVTRAQPVQASADYLAAGDSAYEAFDNHKALLLYEKAYQHDSTFDVRARLSRTYYDYGLDLMAHSEQDEARMYFERAILHAQRLVEVYPDNAYSHFLLAATMGNFAQFESGQRKVAIGRMVQLHSQKAIDLDSTLAYPYVSLGIYYREITQLKWFERTLAKMFYGRLPNISKEDVLKTLHHAVQLRPEFPFLHYELAMTYLMFEDVENALVHLNTLISLVPENSQDIRNQQNARTLIEKLTQ